MKKGSLVVLVLLAVCCFFAVFYFAREKTRETSREVREIHRAAEVAIKEYNRVSAMPVVHYPMNPLFYDKGDGVLACFTVSEIDGVRYRTKFTVLVSREKRKWQAEVVRVRGEISHHKRIGDSK